MSPLPSLHVTERSATEAIRYLDVHPVLPEDAPPELQDSYDALVAPLLLNSALAANRAAQPKVAVDSATRALERLELSVADQGGSAPVTDPGDVRG